MKVLFGENLINGSKYQTKEHGAPAFKGSPQAKAIRNALLAATNNASSASGMSFRQKLTQFVQKHITGGIDVTYKNQSGVLGELNSNFGKTFERCFQDIDSYNAMVNGGKKKLSYVLDRNKNTITFHKDSFAMRVLTGIKEFTAGNLLDAACGIRKGLKKTLFKGEKATSGILGAINGVLDRRVAENAAKDAFFRLSGAFEAVNGNVAGKVLSNEAIKENVQKLATGSLASASKKVGNYNTKSERAWNRLATGFVSALFAATDFYNISMLQNNDPKKANAAGRKRFSQDMRRQLITASTTFIVLGAFQNKVNKSLLHAAMSLGGVALFSEVLSRLMGGISLTPLSPEEAKAIAEKKSKKNARKKGKNKEKLNAQNQNEQKTLINKTEEDKKALNNSNSPKIANDENKGGLLRDELGVFEKIAGIGLSSKNNDVAFTSSKNIPDKKADNKDDKKNKKKGSIGKTALKIFLGAVAASLVVGRLRTKNVLGIDDFIKNTAEKYRNFVDSATTKRLIMSKDEVDGFIDYLGKSNFTKQRDQLVKNLNLDDASIVLKGNSKLVKDTLKGKANADMLYYDLGYVDHNVKKAAFNVLLYPVNTVKSFAGWCNTLIRKLFGVETPKPPQTLIRQNMPNLDFIKKYAGKYTDAMKNGNMQNFDNEIGRAFTRHFSEAVSKNKNTTLALISRPLVTAISTYFFVNDYRNQVLIESKGQDVDRANAVMKERIGHKASNFVLNSMFMDLFNTTFEKPYLSSVAGAVAVAMATEVTNESVVRASICTPTKKMDRDGLIKYENERLNNEGIQGRYYRWFMNLTGKKPLSEKAKKK